MMQPTTTAPSPPSAVVVDKVRTSLINFLLEICPPLIGCSRSQLQATLTRKAESELLKKYVFDIHSRVLIVGREIDQSAAAGLQSRKDAKGEDDALPSYQTFIALEVDKRAVSTTSIAFIKKVPLSLTDEDAETGGEANRTGEALGTKLQVLNIGTSLAEIEERGAGAAGPSTAAMTPFEMLSNYLQYIVDPVFAMHQQPGPGATEAVGEDEAVASTRNISAARKKLTELLVSVKQVQQNVEVPLVQLSVDPVVRDFFAKCKAEGKKFSAEDFVHEQTDPLVMQQLQAGVNKWIKETQKVVQMDRDPSAGTAMEEVNFWTNLEFALNHIEQQLQSPDVEGTLSILKLAKRFLAAASFEIDTGLKAKLEQVTRVNLLMRDFPMNDLLAAASIEQLTLAVRNIFSHLKRIENATHYPLQRAYKFIEAISRDHNTQLYKVLSSHRLLIISLKESYHLFHNCRDLFRVWDEEVRRFKELAREEIKKNGMMNVLPPKLVCEHTLLDRIRDIARMQHKHMQLVGVVNSVLEPVRRGKSRASKEIQLAYSVFTSVEALDVSCSGQDAWEDAKEQYADKIDHAKSQISKRLRDKPGAKKMFDQWESLRRGQLGTQMFDM